MVLILFLGILLSFANNALAFVLISGPTEASLDVSEINPVVTFQVTTEIPNITDRDKFLGGLYTYLSDQDFFSTLIQLAMDPWNKVSTSYLILDFEFSDQTSLDDEDYIHTIALAHINQVAAASSRPVYEEGVIYDCDIMLGRRSISAQNLAFTLMHELGHCLGLGHNHSDTGSAMGYSRSNTELKLGADDILGISYLYGNGDVETPQELIACGSIGLKSPSPWHLLLLVFGPIGLIQLIPKKKTFRD